MEQTSHLFYTNQPNIGNLQSLTNTLPSRLDTLYTPLRAHPASPQHNRLPKPVLATKNNLDTLTHYGSGLAAVRLEPDLCHAGPLARSKRERSPCFMLANDHRYCVVVVGTGAWGVHTGAGSLCVYL